MVSIEAITVYVVIVVMSDIHHLLGADDHMGIVQITQLPKNDCLSTFWLEAS